MYIILLILSGSLWWKSCPCCNRDALLLHFKYIWSLFIRVSHMFIHSFVVAGHNIIIAWHIHIWSPRSLSLSLPLHLSLSLSKNMTCLKGTAMNNIVLNWSQNLHTQKACDQTWWEKRAITRYVSTSFLVRPITFKVWTETLTNDRNLWSTDILP